MNPTLPTSVELLERALGYTRGRLALVTPAGLDAPTPCAGWTLGALLAHMDDALDAFLEASTGPVALTGARTGRRDGVTVAGIQDKACALLGAWTTHAEGRRTSVAVGDRPVPAGLLVAAAALEVTVHGWDVGRATGELARIPAALAVALGPVAGALVTDEDRGLRFAEARPVRPGAAPDHALLAHLGRVP